MQPIVSIQNVTKRYPGVTAVDNVSFDIMPNEFFALLGPSGCGKTTLLWCMAGLHDLSSGEVRLGKEKITGPHPEIAMIFQDPMTSLNPVLTIGQQVSEALQLHMGMNRKQAKQRSIELLEMVNIPQAADRIDDYPHQFSGGMRQRVMIAMALSCNPQLLIADEPTTALDVTIQAQIID